MVPEMRDCRLMAFGLGLSSVADGSFSSQVFWQSLLPSIRSWVWFSAWGMLSSAVSRSAEEEVVMVTVVATLISLASMGVVVVVVVVTWPLLLVVTVLVTSSVVVEVTSLLMLAMSLKSEWK